MHTCSSCVYMLLHVHKEHIFICKQVVFYKIILNDKNEDMHTLAHLKYKHLRAENFAVYLLRPILPVIKCLFFSVYELSNYLNTAI